MSDIYPYKALGAKLPLWGAITALAILFLKDPSAYTRVITEGLYICGGNIIPSLFPYMVLSTLVITSGMAEWLGRLMWRPFSLLFALDGRCAAAVLLGAVAGFPVGAKCAITLYQNDKCSGEEAERLCCFCNNTGPAFVIGGIGAGFFGDTRAGVALYIMQIISAVIIGAIISVKQSRKTTTCKGQINTHFDLSGAIVSSVNGTLSVCGFVLFFTVINHTVTKMLLSAGLKKIIPAITAITEVCAGGKCAAEAGALPIAAFAVGWGGLCVHAQTASLMLPEGLGMKKYMLCKTVQGVMCAVMCIFWQNL